MSAQNAPEKYSPPLLISPANNSKFQSSKNLELKWSEIPGATMFRVQYATDSTFTGDALKGTFVVSGTSIVVYQLEKNTNYLWRVRQETETIWSPIWKFRTTGNPVKPLLYSPLNKSTNHSIPLNFVWSQDSVNAGYILQFSEFNDFTAPKNISVKDTTASIGLLQYGKTYYWRVKGLNADYEESDWSDTLQFKTQLAMPLLFTPLNNSINIDTAAPLSWGGVFQGSNYKVEISTDSIFSQSNIVYTKDTSETEIKVGGLNYLTDYYWHIMAYNNLGDYSKWSETAQFKTKFPLPVLLSPADSSKELDTSVTFTWQQIKDSYKYRLQISTDSLFTKLTVDSLTSSISVKTDSLQFSRSYYWRVNARNKTNDTSNWTKPRFFTTQLHKPLLTLPAADSVNTPTNIDFSWAKTDSTAFYRFQLSNDSLFSVKSVDSLIKKNSISIKYLYNDTLYFWRVKALRSDSVTGSRWSSTYMFKTRPSLSLTPRNVIDTINISENFTDTLSSIIITNFGVNQFTIDKALVYPDTLFYLNKQSATALPGSETIFTIKFYPSRFKTGLTKGKVFFIRKSVSPKDDTLTVDLSLFIQKASASFITQSIIFGNTYANNTYIKNLLISNKEGNSDLKITRCFIEGPDTASFKLLDTIKTIAGGEEKNLRISFKPKRTGSHAAILKFSSNSFKDTLSEFILNGYGLGGELNEESISSISNINSSSFDTFTNNNKIIQFKNSGNSVIKVDFSFKKNYFSIENEAKKTFTLYPEDSVSTVIKYVTPNLRKLNTDTMFVISNGFSKDTIMVLLKGGFDSAQCRAVITNQLKLNSSSYATVNKVFPESNRIVFTLPPDIFSAVPNGFFRLKYFTGGAASKKNIYSDGNNNFIIPAADVNNTGLIFSGEFYLTNKTGVIIDSLEIIPATDAQVLLTSYTTPKIYVPRSKPADKEADADVKWKLIGFPFDNVSVDSVFSYFGGRKNMKDGEWVLYKYVPEKTGSFSLYSDFYFEPLKGYFVAQSLTDSLAVSYKYPENLRTRKLTDTTITFNSSGWKTVTNPFTFDIGISSDIPLRKYDTYRKTYLMTYVMKPGEAYFAEPSVDYLFLKTYGELAALNFPKILSEIGWHIKLYAGSETTKKEILLSVDNGNNNISKRNTANTDFEAAPEFEKGLEFYITKENSAINYSASVQNSEDGAIWNIDLKSSKSNYINFGYESIGDLPKNYLINVVDNGIAKKLSLMPEKIYLQKGETKTLQIIIGTSEFTKSKIAELSNNTITSFELFQNYPNPFNPVTIIKYSIPNSEGNAPRKVEMKVYNTLGKEVAVLVNAYKSHGTYTIEFNGGGLASGVYFYRLKTGGNVITKKMSLIK